MPKVCDASGSCGARLRVLTYNVNFGTFWNGACRGPLPYEAERVLAAVRQSGADVVLLQETNEGWQRAFETLRDVYPMQHFHNDTAMYYAAGSAVLAAPSATLHAVELSRPSVKNVFFSGMVVRAEFRGVALDLVNMHLRPPLSMGNESGGVSGNARAWWYLAPAIHEQEVRHYVDLLRPDAVAIIAGDFNEGSRGGAYRHLRKAGWANALDASSVHTTWHWPLVGPFGLWGSYDHVFFQPSQLSLCKCEVGERFRGASDHLPVTAEFALTGM